MRKKVSLARTATWGLVTAGISAGLLFSSASAAHAETLTMWYPKQDNCINAMRDFMNDPNWRVHEGSCLEPLPGGYRLVVSSV